MKRSAAHRRELRESARNLMSELPTADLYHLTSLLEQALASPSVDERVYDELQKLLNARRPRTRRAR